MKIKKKILIKNKKIKYNFFIKKKFESGISLNGNEVKKIKLGKASINNSYIIIKNNEAYIVKVIFESNNIFLKKNIINRNLKLLLKKKEIILIKNFLKKKKNYNIVPYYFYLKNVWIKVKICLVIGKKKYDKRQNIKNNEWELKKKKILKQNFKYII